MRSRGVVLALVFQAILSAESKWLAVVATSSSVEAAIARTKQLRASLGKIGIVVSDDCLNLKPGLFLSVGEVANDKAAADQSLTRFRKQITDSYERTCEVRPGSRLHFGIDAVDASIFDVPADAVNWDSQDRISSVMTTGSTNMWIRKRYKKEKEDPQEGRRTSILLFTTDPSSAKEVESDCPDAQLAATAGAIAIACGRENAGDNTFHQLKILETSSGRVIRTVEHCRTPKFISVHEFGCDAEAVGPDGELRTTQKRVSLK